MMRNETWMKAISDTVIVIFSNAIMKVTQSQLCLKFFLKNYEAYWQQHFERHPATKDFTDMEKQTF